MLLTIQKKDVKYRYSVILNKERYLMNKKSVFKNLIGAILILCLMMLPNIVNAATMSPSLYFGITELRESGMGYSIGDPGVNGTTGPAAKIWNIVQYSGPDTDDPTETNVYCIKAGVGFVSGEGIKGTQEYNVKFETSALKANELLADKPCEPKEWANPGPAKRMTPTGCFSFTNQRTASVIRFTDQSM